MYRLSFLFLFCALCAKNKVQAQCKITWNGSTCVGNPLNFTGEMNGTTHFWDFNGENTSSGKYSLNYAFKTAGSKTITYITTKAGLPCTTSIQISVFEQPRIYFRLTNSPKQCLDSNLFCFVDSSHNPNGAKIKQIQWLFSNSQLESATDPPFPKQYCFRIYGKISGNLDLYMEVVDANGCENTDTFNNLVSTYPPVDASFKIKAPIGCDTVLAHVENTSGIDPALIKKITWNWGDGSKGVGLNFKDSHVYRKPGYFYPRIIVESIHGCIDSAQQTVRVDLHPSKQKILVDRDSTCISDPTFTFSVDSIPSHYNNFGWTFGDPMDANLGINASDWKNAKWSYTMPGPYLVKLEYYNFYCGTVKIFDTVQVLGPKSLIEETYHRVPEFEVFQCDKPVTDSVHFTNRSLYYHNDANYLDDDSAYYENGLLRHGFGKKSQLSIPFKPRNRRLGDCTKRLWEFGDRHHFQCTTDTKNNINKYVNCNYSMDSLPVHYYKPWEDVMLENYKIRYMEEGVFIDSIRYCGIIKVYASDSMYLLADSILYIPASTADSLAVAGSTYSGYRHRKYLSQKKLGGIGRQKIDDFYLIQIKAGMEAWLAFSDTSIFIKHSGPKTLQLKPGNVLKLARASDTAYFLLHGYARPDTMQADLYKLLRAKRTYAPHVISAYKIPFFGVKGIDYKVNFQRFRDLFYAKVPECYNSRLRLWDTCNKKKCESESRKQIAIMNPRTGGLGVNLLVSPRGCLNDNRINNQVTFGFSGLKPGCTFSKLWIVTDSAASDTFKAVLGRQDSMDYVINGNPGNGLQHGYLKIADPNGCVTVGIVTGNGVSRSGQDRPLCRDTHWYSKLFCLERIDPSYEILKPKPNAHGQYHICPGQTVYARPTRGNLTQARNVKYLNWELITLNAGPHINKPWIYAIQEDYIRNAPLPQARVMALIADSGKHWANKVLYPPDSVAKWKALLADPSQKKLYSYILLNKTQYYPDFVPCYKDSATSEFRILDTDTVITGFMTAWDSVIDQRSLSQGLINAAVNKRFDHSELNAELLTKMIWNGVGVIGNPATGARGCIDTGGSGMVINYKLQARPGHKFIIHPKDTSLIPLDSGITGPGTVEKLYKFTPEWPGSYVLNFRVVTLENCNDFTANNVMVGFHGKLIASDTVLCADRANELKLKAEIRYFDPFNFGKLNTYDHWRDSVRIADHANGNKHEPLPRWDWSRADDDVSNPGSIFGGYPYGGQGIGPAWKPWVKVSDFGNPAQYYPNDSGAYMLRLAMEDSLGCRDTVSQMLYFTKLKVDFSTSMSSPDCNALVGFFDSARILDPRRWKLGNCPYISDDDFIDYYSIDWGDGVVSEFERKTIKDPGLPPKIAHKYFSNGSFKIKYKVRSIKSCMDSVERTVFIPGPAPRFKFTQTQGKFITICLGNSVQFENTTQNASSSADWTYRFGDSVIANTKARFTAHTYTDTGTYHVYLEEYDSVWLPPNIRRFCKAVWPRLDQGDSPMVVRVIPREPIIGMREKPLICPSESNTFRDSSSGAYDQYEWEYYHEGSGFIGMDSTSSKTHSRQFFRPGNYTVIHRARFKASHPPPFCPWPPDTLYFRVDSVEADFDIDSSQHPLICFTRKDKGGTEFRWGFEHGGDIVPGHAEFLEQLKSDKIRVCHTYEAGGRYWICLEVKNSLGCMDTLCKPVDIELYIFIANVFTPGNNDGMNDTYRVPIKGHDMFRFRIYNRWGELMYQSEDPGQGWNGQVHNVGAQAPEGTYFYIVDYRFQLGSKMRRVSGSVNLIRE